MGRGTWADDLVDRAQKARCASRQTAKLIIFFCIHLVRRPPFVHCYIVRSRDQAPRNLNGNIGIPFVGSNRVTEWWFP
jgi:hypothetical protein